MITTRKYALSILAIISIFAPATALAHVKWFSNFSFADLPLRIDQVITPTVIVLAALSGVAMAVAVLLERGIKETGWYSRTVDWFHQRSTYSYLVMRIGLGATLLMAWQADSLLVPRLPIEQVWLGWLQFLFIFLLFFERTTPFAGWGTGFLYTVGMVEFGWFYMLDYVLFVGVAFFLIFYRHPSITVRGLAVPALYFTTGFSLIWVGLEKLVYPQWGLYILQQNPQLALGFPIDFFLVGAAFVELVLGYLLIIGLLERPLALVVTVVFFTTTTIFGKVEVLGHTIIHAALIVFLLEGTGNVYRPPILFHKRTPVQMAFASVNFLLLSGIIFVPYVWGAHSKYEHEAGEIVELAQATTERATDPSLDFDVVYDRGTAWLLTLTVEDFDFVNAEIPSDDVNGDGFAHIYINDQLVGISFEERYQLGPVQPGDSTMRVSLHAPDGSQYIVDGEPLSLEKTIDFSR
ncbi:MAG: DoxX family membrane protein [Chloroflexota bacterium]